MTASPSTSASPTASPTPGPYGVVDQQQPIANVTIDPVQYGQSFTPSLNNVAGFDFYFQTPSTAAVELREFATNNLLGSTGLVVVNPGEQHIDLPAPVAVTPGTKYALIVNTGSLLLGDGPSNPYPAGGIFSRLPFPYDDTNPAGWDMFFRTYASAATAWCSARTISAADVAPGSWWPTDRSPR